MLAALEDIVVAALEDMAVAAVLVVVVVTTIPTFMLVAVMLADMEDTVVAALGQMEESTTPVMLVAIHRDIPLEVHTVLEHHINLPCIPNNQLDIITVDRKL